MSFPNWNHNEVQSLKDLTIRAGKPLEVDTAATLAKHGWTVHMNTYYLDVYSQKTRELDVMAHQRTTFDSRGHTFPLSMFLYVSCKGFTDDQYPVSWSVTLDRQRETDQFTVTTSGVNRGFAYGMGCEAARYVIGESGIKDSTRMLGLKVCEWDAKARSFSVIRKRDHELYEGADSALKAAIWASRGEPFNDIQLHVPVVLLNRKFTNLLIEQGQVRDPDVIHGGFMSSLVPLNEHPTSTRWLLTVMWAAEEFPTLLNALRDALNGLSTCYGKMGLNPP